MEPEAVASIDPEEWVGPNLDATAEPNDPSELEANLMVCR